MYLLKLNGALTRTPVLLTTLGEFRNQVQALSDRFNTPISGLSVEAVEIIHVKLLRKPIVRSAEVTDETEGDQVKLICRLECGETLDPALIPIDADEDVSDRRWWTAEVWEDSPLFDTAVALQAKTELTLIGVGWSHESAATDQYDQKTFWKFKPVGIMMGHADEAEVEAHLKPQPA